MIQLERPSKRKPIQRPRLVWQIVLASRLLAKSQQLHAFLSRGIKLRRHFMPGSHVTAGSKDITKVITRVISRVTGTNIWLGSKLKSARGGRRSSEDGFTERQCGDERERRPYDSRESMQECEDGRGGAGH